MAGDYAVTLRGDEVDLWQSIQKVAKGTAKVNEGFAKAKKTARDAKRANREWGREADKWLAKIRTPQETHNRNVSKLNTLLMTGRINQNQYGRAVMQSRLEMEKAGQAGKKAFGMQAIASIGKYAAGVLGVGAAIGKMSQALTEYKTRVDEIAAEEKGASASLGNLYQMIDNEKDRKAIKKLGDEIFLEGATDTLDEARQIAFRLHSSQAVDEKNLFIRMKASELISDPARMAEAANTMQMGMGVEETGSKKALISKALVASGGAPAKAEELLVAASKSASFASGLEISDEELLAAIPLLASASGGPEEGGTRLRAFISKAAVKGYAAPTLSGMFENIRKKNLSPAQAAKYFGRMETEDAARTLMKNLEQYDTNLADIQAANDGSRLEKSLGEAEKDIDLQLLREERESHAREVVAARNNARLARLNKAARSDIRAEIDSGDRMSWAPKWLTHAMWSDAAMSVYKPFSHEFEARNVVEDVRDPEKLKLYGDILGQIDSMNGSQGGDVLTGSQLDAAAEKLAGAADAMDAAAQRINETIVPTTMAAPDEDR